MSHSFNKIWIHAIWATKERQFLIKPSIEKRIHQMINEQLREMSCSVKIINGMPDHVHCLFLLNSQKSISEVIKQIKGSTSHSINQVDLIPQKLHGRQVMPPIRYQNRRLIKFLSTFRIKNPIIKRKPSSRNIRNF